MTNVFSYPLPSGTPSTIYSSQAGSTGIADEGLALSPTGVLFAATTNGIYSYSASGVPTLVAAISGGAYGIAINSLGDIFVGDDNASTILEYAPAGGGSYTTASSPFESGYTAHSALALD